MTSSGASITKEQAQRRIDRIRLFNEEAEELARQGVLDLTGEQREAIGRYQALLLEQLSGRFDLDRNDTQKRLSLGMQVATVVGALAFSAAVFMFFYRFWGGLSVAAQVAILVAAPLVSVAGTEVAARRERTLYVASILSTVAFACFVLDVSMVAAIFNMRDSPWGLLLWSAFALSLAYAYGLTWLLFIGVVTAAGFVAAEAAQLAGLSFGFFLMRPEGVMLAGALSLAMAGCESRRGSAAFAGTYRLLGWVGLLFPILALTKYPVSYFPLSHSVAGPAYLVLGLLLGGLAAWHGARQHSAAVVNAAACFLSLLLFLKLFEWWWDWMPRYLFFFLVGSMAVGILLLLRRLRLRVRKV